MPLLCYTVYVYAIADCPRKFDMRQNFTESLKRIITCEQPPNCWGIDCCLQLTFTIPLGDTEITRNIPVWFKLDPCDFSLDIGFGKKTLLKTHLLEYEYGKFRYYIVIARCNIYFTLLQ
jgi:hypothetical protein